MHCPFVIVLFLHSHRLASSASFASSGVTPAWLPLFLLLVILRFLLPSLPPHCCPSPDPPYCRRLLNPNTAGRILMDPEIPLPALSSNMMTPMLSPSEKNLTSKIQFSLYLSLSLFIYTQISPRLSSSSLSYLPALSVMTILIYPKSQFPCLSFYL